MFSRLKKRTQQIFYLIISLVLLTLFFHYADITLKTTPAEGVSQSDTEQIKKTYSKLLLNQKIIQDEHENSPVK